MKWGFLYGVLFAAALCAAPLWLWIAGITTVPGEYPVLLFIIMGFASGPGFAFVLYRRVTAIKREQAHQLQP